MDSLKPRDYFVFDLHGVKSIEEIRLYGDTPNLYEKYNEDDDFTEEIIADYELQYFFEVTMGEIEPEPDSFDPSFDPSFYRTEVYIFSFREMTEQEVATSFIKRVFDYFKVNELEVFLDFQYGRFICNPDIWLDYVTPIFKEIDKYINISEYNSLKIKQFGIDWIAKKRQELVELRGEIIEQPRRVESLEGQKKNIVERTKLQWNASRSALYHLFAQLSDNSTERGKIPLNHTPELLAKFLSESFTDLPDIKTIQREIQKYRKTGGMAEKLPPKDAIDIRGIDFSAEI